VSTEAPVWRAIQRACGDPCACVILFLSCPVLAGSLVRFWWSWWLFFQRDRAPHPLRCAGALRLGLGRGNFWLGEGVQTSEAELLEKLRRRAEERRSSDGGGAPDLDHEAMLKETGQRAVAVDATDELDL